MNRRFLGPMSDHKLEAGAMPPTTHDPAILVEENEAKDSTAESAAELP